MPCLVQSAQSYPQGLAGMAGQGSGFNRGAKTRCRYRGSPQGCLSEKESKQNRKQNTSGPRRRGFSQHQRTLHCAHATAYCWRLLAYMYRLPFTQHKNHGTMIWQTSGRIMGHAINCYITSTTARSFSIFECIQRNPPSPSPEPYAGPQELPSDCCTCLLFWKRCKPQVWLHNPHIGKQLRSLIALDTGMHDDVVTCNMY